MEVETPILSDEQFAPETRRSSPIRVFGLGAVALVAVCLGGSTIWTRSKVSPDITDAIGLHIEDREVEIQVDMTGILYSDFAGTPAWGAGGNPAAPTQAQCDLSTVAGVTYNAGVLQNTREDAFKKIVSFVVAKKAQIPSAAVDITEEPATTNTPERTEFPVTISVPSELSASVLMSRLNEGGTLLKEVEDMLIACHLADASIDIRSVMRSRKGKSVVLEAQGSQGNPQIHFDMDIKGLDYTQLGLSEAAKTKFVEAVRSGIVPPGLDVDAESIALDISNGGLNNRGVPFVHVDASLPVPASISADATMSKWPGGRAQIGARVTANLKKDDADIRRATRVAGSTTEFHEILVLPGMLSLGGLRSSYATEVSLLVEVNGLAHAAAAATDPTVEQIRDRLKAALKKEVGKDDVEVKFMRGAPLAEVSEPLSAGDRAALNADPLVMSAIISHGETASVNLKDAAVWESKLIPAVRSTEASLRNTFSTSVTAATYGFKIHVPKLSNEVSTYDLDMVVSGIDYESFRPEKKGAFLIDLAARVRTAINHLSTTPISDVVDDIRVLVSSQSGTDALNVRAQIPAPADAASREAMTNQLEKDIQSGDLKEQLESGIRGISGIGYVSTWTPTAIKVSLPGHINDFSGDIVGSADAL